MKKHILLTAVITAMVVSACFVGFYFLQIRPLIEENSLTAKINEIQALIDAYAVKDFDRETAEDYATAYYLAGLDDIYCEYMLPEGYGSFLDDRQGNFTGVGISVYTQQGNIVDGITVLRVLGNSPAEEAGILPLDIITAVDGITVIGEDYNAALDRILGEVDSEVALTVNRNGTEHVFNVIRKTFVQRLVDYRMINGDIGFIRIHSFDANAYGEFAEAIDQLTKLGAKGFIFDVRNNPGGSLAVVQNMVDILVGKEEIVVIQYKDREDVYYGNEDIATELPAVILANSSSASAAELFSSALRDINGTPIIGEQTFGKGVGQTTYELSDGSALKITTFNYVTKSRTDYDQTGLVPDVEISLDEADSYAFYTLDETNDEQLIVAIDELYSIINN